MSARVHRETYCGQQAVRLENGALEAVAVPGWGGNLIALREAERGVQILREPSSAAEYGAKPALFGIPVLFPPNRIADGVFHWGGRTYRWPLTEPERCNHIHGFLHTRPWQLAWAEAAGGEAALEMRFDAREHPDVLAVYPHPFVVSITYILRGDALAQRAVVSNEGGEPMPWGLGYHTTFRFPFRAGDALENCRLRVSIDKQWELDERLLPTGRQFEPADRRAWQTGFTPAGRALDDAFSGAPAEGADGADGWGAAVLEDSGCGLAAVYRCAPGYRHWVVYNADSRQGFVCPEPYTWITNAPNLDLPADATGFAVLAPGGRAVLESEIAVRRI